MNLFALGGVVVHCFLGSGRTGTLMSVLLFHEMLLMEGNVDPVEVVRGLQSQRARMVENAAQYNFALEVLDEILFGNATSVSIHDILDRLPSLRKESILQYKRANALPSSLTYKYSSKPDFQRFNRNPNILPADNQQVCLQTLNGEIETQYINAIKVPGFAQRESMLITEHPMTTTREKFWRLVMEKRCPIVILINQFAGYSEEEYPPLLTSDGYKWTETGYSVQHGDAEYVHKFLVRSSASITNTSGEVFCCTVYQVLEWQFGRILPDSLGSLITLADLLLETVKTPDNSTPLLCCGDGVTGCGVVAAVCWLVEQAKAEQVVDVYRTVVKLRRCRQEFIVSEEQFTALYVVVSKLQLRQHSK